MRLQDAAPFSHSSRWKGKQKELPTRDEGSGGPDGIVLDLQLLSDSPYQAAYVVPLLFGDGQQKLLLQLDSGSSDLWVTSTTCSTSLCNEVGSNKYDQTGAVISGVNLQLQYADGEADGPVVWDEVQLGGYSIDHQAFISASNVVNEPLSSQFNGVLGLAPPANSYISYSIPATSSDAYDGATLPSNLFSITPASTAPGARFLSFALERPGSDRVPSVLAIGRHPSLVSDPSKIQYDSILSTSQVGPEWWQVSVQAITVYVDGKPKHVSLPSSVTGASVPNAILDSGVPLIIASPTIANGIYGALGISPASDGNYYISCTTPINVTIQLDNRTAIPLHPLDLSYYPPNDASSVNCIGVIQTPAQVGISLGPNTDMILGVPFLRNTYTVLAYDPPYANGSFPANAAISASQDFINPRLGLLNLTDPAIAADEFHQVRVLKQPLGKTVTNDATHSKGLSVGVEVLIALLGFFGLCFVLFGARWAYMKRRYARERAVPGALDGKAGAFVVNDLGYQLTPMGTPLSGPSEDELRQRRFEAYKRRQMSSMYTDDTASTFVDPPHTPEPKGADEFGAIKLPETPATPIGYFDPWGDTLVDSRPTSRVEDGSLLSPPPRTARRSDYSARSVHHRTPSGGPSADVPLLSAHGRSDSNPRDSEDIAEFGVLERPQSMAGVGTASRSRRISSLPGSPLATPKNEYPPSIRRPSHESRRSRASVSPPPPHELVLVPPAVMVPSPSAVPMLHVKQNDSGVSNLGHGS